MFSGVSRLSQAYREQVTQSAFKASKSGPEGIVAIRQSFDREALRLRNEASFAAACRMGCSACCHRSVRVTFPELLELTGIVQQSVELEKRVRHYAGETKDSLERLAAPVPIACPFLNVPTQTCSVYEQRPMFCRGWSSSDPVSCERFKSDPESGIPPHCEEENELCDVATQGVILGVASAGAPSGLYEMASAITTLLDAAKPQPQVEPTEIERVKVFSEITLRVPGMPPRLKAAVESPQGKKFTDLYVGQSNWQAAWDSQRGSSAVEVIRRMAFPRVHDSEDQIDEFFLNWEAAVEEFASHRGDALELYEALAIHDTFPLAYTGRSVRRYLQRHGEVVTALLERVAPDLLQPLPPRKPGKGRIGYISGRLKDFNGARWALGWLKTHSKEVETYAFNLAPTEDVGTQAFRRLADHYFHVPFDPLQVAHHIRSLDLDLLVWTDLGMGGVEYQLAPFRLARMQATAWGHPVTSGLPNLDYYLSSDLMEPEDAQGEYTEKLVRLPGSGLAYPPLTGRASDKSKADFGLGTGTVYLSCQNPMKYVAKYDHIYAEITERANSEIVFVGGLFKGDLQLFKRRFQRANIRARWIEQLPARDYLRLIQLADVVLDAPAWNGGNTTIEALSYGKPVVSMPTQFMRGRHAAAFLSQAQVPELLCSSEGAYIDAALGVERLTETMRGASPERLFMDPAPAGTIEQLLHY